MQHWQDDDEHDDLAQELEIGKQESGFRVKRELPILDIVAVLLALAAIIVSIVVASGAHSMHSHLKKAIPIPAARTPAARKSAAVTDASISDQDDDDDDDQEDDDNDPDSQDGNLAILASSSRRTNVKRRRTRTARKCVCKCPCSEDKRNVAQ
jgi:hypothetical protein